MMNINHVAKLRRYHEKNIWIGEKGHVPFRTSGKLFTNIRTF